MAEIFSMIEEAVGIYDADDRLVAFNARYAEVRHAIGGRVEHGVAWIDLVRTSVIDGKIPEASGEKRSG
jgi:hypothetical protein